MYCIGQKDINEEEGHGFKEVMKEYKREELRGDSACTHWMCKRWNQTERDYKKGRSETRMWFYHVTENCNTSL